MKRKKSTTFLNQNPKSAKSEKDLATQDDDAIRGLEIDEVSDDIGKLYNSEILSDVTFRVKSKEIPAHRIVLAARSEYFEKLLLGGLKESKSRVVDITEDTPFPAFLNVLEYLYKGKICLSKEQKIEHVLDILVLSHKYGLIKLETSLLDHVLKKLLTPSDTMALLKFNEIYEYEILNEACFGIIDSCPEELKHQKELHCLSANSVRNIITRTSLVLKEEEKFDLIKEWCERNPVASSENKNVLINAIHMDKIPTTVLMKKVWDSNIIPLDLIRDAVLMQNQKELPNCKKCAEQSQDKQNNAYETQDDGIQLAKSLSNDRTQIEAQYRKWYPNLTNQQAELAAEGYIQQLHMRRMQQIQWNRIQK